MLECLEHMYNACTSVDLTATLLTTQTVINYNKHAVDEVEFVIVLCKECEGYILTHMHMSICIHKHKEA